MNLDEALREASRSSRTCRIADIRALLSADDNKTLDAAFVSEMSSRSIGRAIRMLGITVSDTTIQKHRAGDCPCP